MKFLESLIGKNQSDEDNGISDNLDQQATQRYLGITVKRHPFLAGKKASKLEL